ncbi:MAG TPA: hypothetical protein VKE69_13580, partial [Planctomycetota bacterium]|nr:hypothetical protein [Planctomycetota bacterium]
LVAALLASAVFLGSYWYVRNAVLFGNPFFPTPFHLFGAEVFAGSDDGGQQGSFQLASMLENLGDFARERIFDSAEPYHPDLPAIAGWGWALFSVGLPSLAYAALASADVRRLLASFVVSLVVLFGFVSHDDWNCRFATWLAALPALGVALALDRLRDDLVRGAIVALATAGLALNYANSWTLGVFGRGEWKRMWELPVEERSTIACGVAVSPTYGLAFARIAPDEVLAVCMWNGEGSSYALYGADLSRRICHVRLEGEAEVRASMRRAGARRVFVPNPAGTVPDALQLALRSGWLKRVEGDLYAIQD